MKEFELIEKYFKSLATTNKAAQNLADDVARISIKNDEELVISKDVFVEDVHFLRSDGGFKIASKLLRTNLSDLASSGATPLYYMLGFSKNKNTDTKFLRDFCRGLKSLQDEFDLSLIGGDTVESEKLFFSVTVFGSVKKGETLSRQNAKAGDLIFVSGTIGDAFLGLEITKKNLPLTTYHLPLSNRHFFPTPRIELGKALLKQQLSNCAIDVSDGLFADLGQICKSAKLAAEINLEQVPLSKSAQSFLQKNPEIKITDLVSGGDDYELLFAVNPKNRKKISELSKSLKLDLTYIGSFREPSKKPSSKKFSATVFDSKNRKIKINKTGYEH